MALEFPDGFPFNRKRTVDAATEVTADATAPAASPDAPAPAAAAAGTAAPAAVDSTTAAAAPAPGLVDLTALVSVAKPPPGIPERRRAPRQTLVAKATVCSEARATVVASGFLSNISMAGVGFHTRRPLQVGDKYQLRVEVGPMKWASRLRVVTCRPHGETYDIGAEFVGNDLATLSRRELAA